MKTRSDKPILSEKEIQERLENGKRISKEDLVKKFKSIKVPATK